MTRPGWWRAWALALGVMAAIAPAGAQGTGDALDRAMRDELARSMARLRLGQLERPYFIAYWVHEISGASASASQGSLLSSTQTIRRTLWVDVRVGSYAFDNTNAMAGGAMGFAMSGDGGGGDDDVESGEGSLPLDDDYVELRRQMWLATDATYKGALETLAGKRAAIMNRTRRDSLPDFTREDTTLTVERGETLPVDRTRLEALVRDLSRVSEVARLSASRVDVEVFTDRVRYLNSEGTSYTVSRPLVTLTAAASTQARDGMPLSNAVTVYARRLDSLPPRDRLAAEVRAMALGLDTVGTAALAERYNGPVLFEGRAAAQLFAAVFAPGLTPRRKVVFPSADMEGMFDRMASLQGASLVDRIGSRLLPDFLSVVDDPTRAAYDGRAVFGGYPVDDDGVRARSTVVVDRGILKAVLTTRTPVEPQGRSTGNHRGLGASASNMIVESREGLGDSALTARLVALVKTRGLSYGIVVRDLGEGGGATMREQMQSMFASMTDGGGGGRPRSILRAYKVYPDGREECIRGARLTGLTAESFHDIAAASAAVIVYTKRTVPAFGAMFGGGGGDVGAALTVRPPVTYVVPSLLFEDATLTRPTEEFPKPPLSAPPAS
jgi:hypothetical protein